MPSQLRSQGCPIHKTMEDTHNHTHTKASEKRGGVDQYNSYVEAEHILTVWIK